MKLEEGKNYTFMVVKTIRFEGMDYFIFQGPDDKRYLVPASRYENYNIETGNQISCRIDKINCKGEIFLEPEHPYYQEGRSYIFDVTGSDVRVDRAGKKHDVFIVTDRYGNEISVPVTLFGQNCPSVGGTADLMIGRIAKGNILFTGMADERHSQKEEGEVIHDFIVNEEVKGLDGREYYLISETNGVYYTIPCDYYRHYGLSMGKKFKGRFVRYKAGEEVRIEPVNPYFTPGNSYAFRIAEVVELNASQEWITVVIDEYDFHHNVNGDLGLKPGKEVVLIVERIRKGWPRLQLV